MLGIFLKVHLIPAFQKGFNTVADIYVLSFNQRERWLDLD